MFGGRKEQIDDMHGEVGGGKKSMVLEVLKNSVTLIGPGSGMMRLAFLKITPTHSGEQTRHTGSNCFTFCLHEDQLEGWILKTVGDLKYEGSSSGELRWI